MPNAKYHTKDFFEYFPLKTQLIPLCNTYYDCEGGACPFLEGVAINLQTSVAAMPNHKN